MKFYTNFTRTYKHILFRGYLNGKRVSKRISYKPYLFIRSNQPSEYNTIHGKPVERVDFASLKEARDFIQRYQDVENFDIYGMSDFEYVLINDLFKGEIKFDPTLIRVAPIDIEVASDKGFPDIQAADKPITAISYLINDNIYVFGCGEYTAHQDNITYFKCTDERDLILKFIDHFAAQDVDVITGWNVEMFDIPYIINRIINLFGADTILYRKLSPWNIVKERVFNTVHGEQRTYEIVGIAILDYLPLYKKFSFKEHESYKLDYVAYAELGKNKVDYSEYESLLDLYEKDHQKFIEYNVRDITLIPELEDKKRFLQQVYGIAFDAKVNFNDALTTVRMWDVIIHNYLIDQKIVVPQNKPATHHASILGGYVKDPVPGKYDWVVSFDLTSLYPMIIQQYNISPDTFAHKIESMTPESVVNGAYNNISNVLSEENVTITPNGCLFSRNKQGFYPALMEKLFEQRKQYKDQMLEKEKLLEQAKIDGAGRQQLKQLEDEVARLHSLQYSKKIQLNSAYGALSNRYYRWYNADLAEGVTSSGQLTTRWIEKATNQWLNKLFNTTDHDYVIACDTDSMYISMERFVDQMIKQQIVEEGDTLKTVELLDKICKKKVEPFLAKQFDKLAEYVNAYKQKMHMKRECIGDTAVWVAKKRYIMNVYNDEGVQLTKPKTKVTGIEAVRSSTPAVCRENIKKALTIILNGDNDQLIEFIDHFREQFKQMFFEDVAFPRGIHKLDQYKSPSSIYTKGTPIHVRGALVYNHMIKKYKIDHIYETIHEGDKIKFCYLKMPNPMHENVISVPNMLPKQLELGMFIDYDTQFDKAFLEPIHNITKTMGWTLEIEAQVAFEEEDQPNIEQFIEE